MKPIDRKIARIRAGLKQDEVARLVGCSRPTISFLETGSCDVSIRYEQGYDRLLARLEKEAAPAT